MGTTFIYKGRNIEPQCEIRHADTFPCFDFLDNNSSSNYVDLVCNNSHFVRMNVELDDNGAPVLKNGDDSKIISGFVEAQKSNYSLMPDRDKEMFEDFISFISIKHSYGSAVSMRVLIEDFFKDNFLAPAIQNYLSNQNRRKLFNEARSKRIHFLSLSLHKITFKGLLHIMENGLNPVRNSNSSPNLKRALNESFWNYISSDSTGKIRRLNKDESDIVNLVFDTISTVIHGGRFDAIQVFNDSRKFFDLLSTYFQGKRMKWGK